MTRFGKILIVVALTGLTACSDEPAQTAPACIPAADVDDPTLDEALAAIDGLSFDAFIDASYREVLRRSPETLTRLNLSASMGAGDDRLDTMSDAFITETYDVIDAILQRLHSYDRAALTPAQQRSYDVYAWYLDDWSRQRAVRYFDYPINPIIISAHRRLLLFFENIHPITSADDARDYIARLRHIPTKLNQVREGLRLREQRGVVLPGLLLDFTISRIRLLANSDARAMSLYTSFASKLASVPDVSDADRDALLVEAQTAIDCHVKPAFTALVDTLDSLRASAPTEVGVSQFDGGAAYYDHALRHHTTTEMTASDIHQLGLDEVARIRAEMQALFDAQGYPPGASLSEQFDRVAQDSGIIADGQVKAEYEAIIAAADRDAEQAFGVRPRADVIVVDSGGGAFYVAGTLDGSRPGAFYANLRGPQPRYGMPTLAYHEAIPGHHFQISLAQEQPLPLFRTNTTFTSYVEGWALYTERLAADVGWYADDPHGDLGRLQAEIYRAARLVVDTGIHAMGWDFEQAVTYMIDNVGYPRPSMESEVARYISWPGQATAYKAGMLRILALRQRAMDQLGDAFDIKTFHASVLSSGSVPLDVLDRFVSEDLDLSTSGLSRSGLPRSAPRD